LRLLRQRSFAVYVLGSLGGCAALAVNSQGTPLLLDQLGMPRAWLLPALTLAQSTGIVTLGLLPRVLPRAGARRTMLLGLSAAATGLAVLAGGGPLWLVVSALGCWGLLVCCYLVAGQVYVNSLAQGDIRASVQALLAFTNAIGLLLGNLAAGWIRGAAGGALTPMFALAAIFLALLVGMFFVGFREERRV